MIGSTLSHVVLANDLWYSTAWIMLPLVLSCVISVPKYESYRIGILTRKIKILFGFHFEWTSVSIFGLYDYILLLPYRIHSFCLSTLIQTHFNGTHPYPVNMCASRSDFKTIFVRKLKRNASQIKWCWSYFDKMLSYTFISCSDCMGKGAL